MGIQRWPDLGWRRVYHNGMRQPVQLAMGVMALLRGELTLEISVALAQLPAFCPVSCGTR